MSRVSRARGATRQLSRAARAAWIAARDATRTPPPPADSIDREPERPDAGVDYERIESIVRSVADEVWGRRLDLPGVMSELAFRDSARFVLDNVPLHLGKLHSNP